MARDEHIEPQRGKRRDDRTLRVEIETDDLGTETHHVNVDNVSYVAVTRGALTRWGVVVLLGASVVVGVLVSRWGTVEGLGGFVATAVGLYALVQVEDRVEIGTTADTHRIAVDEAPETAVLSGFRELGRDLKALSQEDVGAIVAIAGFLGGALWIITPLLGVLGAVVTAVGLYWSLPATRDTREAPAVTTPAAAETPLETAFVDRSPELIVLDRAYDAVIRRYDYRYYVVPDNVVSITETQTVPFWMKALGAVVALTGLAALYSLTQGRLANTLTFGLIAILGGLVFLLLAIPVHLDVVSHGNIRKRFELHPDDADTLLAKFSERGPGPASEGTDASTASRTAADAIQDRFD